MQVREVRGDSRPTAAGLDGERAELQAVLSSGILNRAPNLEHLLSYICSRYFEGAAGQIKEYNIAVEALGRPQDFDQKKDSIVRVEAHKLRKRLREYYQSEGAHHRVRIEIPSGQYAPKFVIQENPSSPAFREEPIAQQVEPRRWRWQLPSIAALLATASLLAGIAYWGSVRGHKTLRSPAADIRGSNQATDTIRILAGVEDGTYIDGFGREWQRDRFFQGGSAIHNGNQSIQGTRDQQLYQNRREGTFAYSIPLKPGVYELRLHFAEALYGEGNAAGGGETSPYV